jgi:hypothetical protein
MNDRQSLALIKWRLGERIDGDSHEACDEKK